MPISAYDPPVTEDVPPTDPDSDGRSWTRIGDFRSGIHTAVAPTRPNGYAQETNTYCCYASTAGSLIPTPRLIDTITRTLDDGAGTLLSEQYRITGLMANGPVYASSGNTTGTDEVHTELILASEWWMSDTGDILHLDVSRYTRNKTSPAWEELWDRTYVAGTYSAATRPRVCWFTSQRSNPTTPLASGPQVVGWVYSANARMFPDAASPTSTGTDPLPADAVGDAVVGVDPTALVGHQGRFVIFPLYTTGDGDNQVYISSECAYWTPVNDGSQIDTNLTTYFNILGGYETASGYGVFASLTADELFLVKIKGGGLFVSGDLNTPTVRTLPYVRSTGLAFCNGTPTSIGFAYPVDSSGVWLWAGGDSSEHVTKHLRPDFWRPSTLVPTYSDTPTAAGWGYSNCQAATWNELVLWPANWMWDTDDLGWWKILGPDAPDMSWWVVDERGRYAWGAPMGWTTTSDPLIYEFSRESSATYYSWQGHPITATIDRETAVSEVIVCGQGNGKVRITITSPQDRNNPWIGEVTFDGGTSQTQMKRVNAKLTGTSLVFRIESIGADHDETLGSFDPDATVAAPTVHYVDYASTAALQLNNRT
jgi:hypothetical protein